MATSPAGAGGIVRERGTQSRRVRDVKVEPARRPAPPSRGGTNFWQGLAIVALIAATAGWTTVAVLALRGPGSAAAIPSVDPNATADASTPPDVPSHDVPDLEAFLPSTVKGAALDAQSVTGDDGLLGGDAWSTAMTTFLTAKSKTATDLQYAFASDPTSAVDISVGVYRVAGVDGPALRDALVQGWKALAPDVKISNVTLDGKDVVKGDDGTDYPFSYLYVRGGLVYELYTSDESIATAALAALPVPGASVTPVASASAKASNTAPSSSPAASPAP
jgi:hypothetical protein